MPFPAQVEQWRSLLSRFGSDLPIDFQLAWLLKESGGNACALGIPNVEAGIFQTFHPADDRFGATFGQLRAACSGSKLVRPLTPDEAALQAKAGTNFIRGKRDTARAHFAAAGIRFPESSTDFWTGVKQEHALPCVMADLPRITAFLGHPPRSWDEIHRAFVAIPASKLGSGCANFKNSPSLKGLSSRLEDTLVNAEEVGKFGGTSLFVKLGLGALIAFAAYKLWTSGEEPAQPTS